MKASQPKCDARCSVAAACCPQLQQTCPDCGCSKANNNASVASKSCNVELLYNASSNGSGGRGDKAPFSKAATASYGACELRADASGKQKSILRGDDSSSSSSNNNNKRTTGRRRGSSSRGSNAPTSDDEESDEMAEQKSLLHRAAKVIPCLGILLALCASFFLGSAGMLVKMTHSVHGIQVAVFRAMIQLVVYGFVISVRRLPLRPRKGEVMPVLARAILGGSSITFSYYALRLIPLGDATTIRFSLPIWTLIVSYLMLNESCSAFKVGAVVVCISGVVLIAKPDDCVYLLHVCLNGLRLESDSALATSRADYERAKSEPAAAAGLSPSREPYQQFEGSVLALSSSIFLALSLIALRLCKRTPAEITILWLSTVSILIGSAALLLLGEWRLPGNWRDVGFILLNGLCGSVGQWFITSALKIEQSGVISLARTFDIEVAFLYSAFLLHEQIRVTSIVGSVLVSFGVVAVVVPKWLDSRSEARRLRQQQRAEQSQVDQQRPQRQLERSPGERNGKSLPSSANNGDTGPTDRWRPPEARGAPRAPKVAASKLDHEVPDGGGGAEEGPRFS